MRIFITSVLLFAAASTAAAGPAKSHVRRAKAAKVPLVVTSSAFRNTEAIPQDYTCEGVKRPPPLAWSKVPPGTKSFAILVEDTATPRAFTHWLVTGIPATTHSVEPGTPLPAEAIVSHNGNGSDGYAPPCPPHGRHRYVFHVYALDTDADAAKPTTRAELMTEIKGHVLAEGAMVGTFKKTR
jgi:hypothetical protein